jgi:hypothetical protein
MKKALILSLGLLISCGSNNELDTPAPEVKGNPERLTQFDETVDVGNFVVFETPSVMQISSGTKCSYKITTRVDIVNADPVNDAIDLRIRKKDKESRRNSRQCPESYGVNAEVVKTYKYSSIHKAYTDRAKQSLDAELFCKETSWCKRAELLVKKDSYYGGEKVKYTLMRVLSKSGKFYKRTAWVAKGNVFLNTIAFQLKTWNGNKLIDYKKTIDFSYKRNQ